MEEGLYVEAKRDIEAEGFALEMEESDVQDLVVHFQNKVSSAQELQDLSSNTLPWEERPTSRTSCHDPDGKSGVKLEPRDQGCLKTEVDESRCQSTLDTSKESHAANNLREGKSMQCGSTADLSPLTTLEETGTPDVIDLSSKRDKSGLEENDQPCKTDLKRAFCEDIEPGQQSYWQDKFSKSERFVCHWCPFVYAQQVDVEKHMKHSHKVDYIKLLHEKSFGGCNIPGPYQDKTSPADRKRQLKEVKKALHRSSLKLSRNFAIFKSIKDSTKQRTEPNVSTDLNFHDTKQDECGPILNNPSRDGLENYTNAAKSLCNALIPKLKSRVQRSEKPFKCDLCGKGFGRSGHLARHRLIHSGEKPFSCDICKRPFESSWNLSRHRRIHTGEKPYKCEECGVSFPRNSDLSSHKSVHTGFKAYTCDICSRGFDNVVRLSEHIRTHTGEKPHQCDTCGKEFGHRSGLFHHKKTHLREKPYQCDVCDKEFVDKSSLTRHQKIHSEERPYMCDVCGKEFRHNRNLVRHKLTHSDEKPYQCNECGKEFTLKDSLIRHKRTHTVDRPFKCDLCFKEFKHSHNLFRHKAVHLGEMPYQCDVCGKKFGHWSVLSCHKKTHTGEKPYKCDMCGKRFGLSHHLLEHQRTHTGEKPYKCNVCGKDFGHSRSLSRHKTTHANFKPCQNDDAGFGLARDILIDTFTNSRSNLFM